MVRWWCFEAFPGRLSVGLFNFTVHEEQGEVVEGGWSEVGCVSIVLPYAADQGYVIGISLTCKNKVCQRNLSKVGTPQRPNVSSHEAEKIWLKCDWYKKKMKMDLKSTFK